MTIEEMDVLLLHQFHQPHPAHRVFADAVGADYRHFETGEQIGGEKANLGSMFARLQTAFDLDEYDLVVGEGTIPTYTLLFYKALNNPQAAVVPLIADETFLKIRAQKSHHLWKGVLSHVFDATLTGAIAVGSLAQSWAAPYLSIPFEVVHPCIDASKYELLHGVKEGYDVSDRPTILHAGTVSDREAVVKKNVPTLARTVAGQDGWQLRLVGAGHDERKYATLPDVHATGYVEDLSTFAEEFATADVYVQPSNGDAFPVASLEAMLAGLPTIVSTRTGTREIVEPIDSNLVCEPSEQGVRAAIQYVLSLEPTEREEIGGRLRSSVEELTEQRQAERFKHSVESLLS